MQGRNVLVTMKNAEGDPRNQNGGSPSKEYHEQAQLEGKNCQNEADGAAALTEIKRVVES